MQSDVRCRQFGDTYPHEKMLIKILAFRVLLRLFLYSASFIQVDALDKLARVSATKIIAPAAASSELKLKLPSFGTTPPACKTNLPFFLVLIFVLNNKSTNTHSDTLFFLGKKLYPIVFLLY